MNEWSVDDELRQRGLDSADDGRTRLIRGVASRYVERSLLDHAGRRVRLSCECPRHCICWQADRQALAPGDAAEDAVALPWVGQRYETERILVVGTNFNRGGGLGAHWGTCELHIAAMQAGKPGYKGHPYARRAMSAVRVVRDSRRGRLDETWQPPPAEELADDWHSVAYLQAVKCAPERARGEPFREMYDECPPLTLMPELTTLVPRVMLLLGRGRVRDPVRGLLRREANLAWGASPGSLERDVFTIGRSQCTLLCLNHPATRDGRRWQDSLDQLVEQLIAQPVP
jgi:hypothetical protein